MNHNISLALLCAVLAGWMPSAGAESIYRCGASYSHKPCPGGGKLIEIDDARTSSQKAQTDQAVRRDAKAADAMEKARLREEAKPAQLVMPPARHEPLRPVTISTMKKPEQFTAVAPGTPGEAAKKKKKARKKNGA